MNQGFALLATIFLVVPSAGVPLSGTDPTVKGKRLFENEVRPLLARHRHRCHGERKQKAALCLDSRAALLHGGVNGQVLVPGKLDRSVVIQTVRHTGDLKMPPQKTLSKANVGSLERWVKKSAPYPATKDVGRMDVKDGSRTFWPLQPLRNPPPPTTHGVDAPPHPTDRFIAARLRSEGIEQCGGTDKRTLIRQATYDLAGLPPSSDEVDVFLRDKSPRALGRLVDHLLRSLSYGEQRGRHRLDLVRHADTIGKTADFPVREAYLYRNYVIESFNTDTSYDQFIRERIAGGLLAECLTYRHVEPGYRLTDVHGDVVTGLLS